MRNVQKQTHSLVLTALFAALLIIFNYFRIEIGPVPITLQTIIILLAGSLLGAFRGAMVVVIVVLINILHFPAFPDKAGFTLFVSITFGYIIGWMIAAFFVGIFIPPLLKSAHKGSFPYLPIFLIYTVAALFIIYIFGILWAGLLFNQSLKSLWVYFVAPFIIPDFIKVILATYIVFLLQKYRLLPWG